jgi:hypothetical protein
MITRLLSSPLPEFQETGEKLFAQLHPIAPSLFPEKYIHAMPYPQSGLSAIEEVAAELEIGPQPADANSTVKKPSTGNATSDTGSTVQGAVRLVRYDPDGERHLAAALLFHGSQTTLEAARQAVTDLNNEEVGRIIRAAYRGLHAHDTLLREFELLHYQFELVMSESAYHQFIRHRMKTEVSQAHSPIHGRTVPPRVRNAGFADRYRCTLDLLEETFQSLGADQRAEIILANGHNLRILADLNAREIVEMSRIRSDRHAQWDIRTISDAIVAAVEKVHPYVGLACGGRDTFKDGTAAVLPDT